MTFQANINLTTIVHYEIFGKLCGTSTAPQKKQFSYVSKQVTMQTFPNTIAMLHYMYITYIKKCNIFTCFETKLKPAS